MSSLFADPPRLKEHYDQLDVAERIAGQVVRDMPEPVPLAGATLASIAAAINARRNGRGMGRLGYMGRLGFMVGGGVLLGWVTAASAARLDLIPNWITRVVHGEARTYVSPTGAGMPKARRMAKLVVPPPPALGQDEGHVPPAPSLLGASRPAPGKEEGFTAHAQLAGGQSVKPLAAHSREVGQPSPPVTGETVTVAAKGGGARLAWLADGHQPRVDDGEGLPAPGPARAPASLAGPAEHPLAPAIVVPERLAPSTAPLMGEHGPVAPRAGPEPDDPGPHSSSGSPHGAAQRLREAVHALRVDHSPRQALAILDRNADELPDKTFVEETLLLRVEAMLDLGQHEAVLRLLDGATLTGVAASRDLLLTRGQLRAAANRCVEGIGDFDLVLEAGGRPPRQALLGRASCRRKLGDVAGARADLERYQREFPDAPVP